MTAGGGGARNGALVRAVGTGHVAGFVPRPGTRSPRLPGMTSGPSGSEARHSIAVDPAATPIPPALEPDAHEAYRVAARWTGIRLRQGQHDGAGVVAAYHAGYLDGLRDAAEGHAPAPDASADNSAGAEDDDGATGPAGGASGAPSLREAVGQRARTEGYADGLRWREPARRGGLVRLMLFLTGKSAGRFAAEDLMRSPRRVRRMIAYNDVVEDVIRDELLRRLSALRMLD